MCCDKAVLEEKLLELDWELTSLRGAAGALCSHMLGVGTDVAPSVARLEAVQGRIEELITEGRRSSCGVRGYEGVDFAVVSGGFAGGQSDEDLDRLTAGIGLHAQCPARQLDLADILVIWGLNKRGSWWPKQCFIISLTLFSHAFRVCFVIFCCCVFLCCAHAGVLGDSRSCDGNTGRP
jgi:hypothetical protein